MAPDLLTAPVSGIELPGSSFMPSEDPLTSRDTGQARPRSGEFIILVRQDAPEWLLDSLNDIVRLRALPAGWDSYGSPSLSDAVARSAMTLLGLIARARVPRPDIVPTNAGGIAFEWSTRLHSIEVEINSPGQGHLCHENLATGAEDELDFTDAPVLEGFLALVST
jgi:hypothetical protein